MLLRVFIASSLPVAIVLAGGCANAQADKPPAGPQLIVKFRSATLRCDQPAIDHLSARTGYGFEFVRPMSGDACVIRLRQPADAAAALATLRSLPDVEYAEPDTPMHPVTR